MSASGASFGAVVFDLFGTLVPDIPERIYGRMAQRLDLPEARFRELWSRDYAARAKGGCTFRDSIEQICKDLGLTVSPEVIQEAVSMRTEGTRWSLASVTAVTLSILSLVADRGLRRGLLSNTSPDVAGEWASCALSGQFEAVVFSSEVGLMKPEPEIFQLICQRLGVFPTDCLYVGDGGDQELAGAAAAGMTPVQIRGSRPLAPEARFVIQSPAELLPILGMGGGVESRHLEI